MIAKAAVFAGLAASAAAQPWPLPNAWPLQHTHQEVMFTPSAGTIQNKNVWYSFDFNNISNCALRYDIEYMSGPLVPLVTLINFTSYWLGTDLYMFTYEAADDPIPDCVKLSMGFGMMYPDWFRVNSTQVTTVWDTRRDGEDPAYHRVLMSQKGDGVSPDPFTYYSFLIANETAPTIVNGSPYKMSAPSPTGLVVNEYYAFVDKTPNNLPASDPIFALPSQPACIPTDLGSARTAHEAFQLLRAAGKERLAPAMVEVLVAGMDAHRRA